jgi:hypothetical protein
MPKNVDLSKSINREKVIEPSIANNEKNIGCPPLVTETKKTGDHETKKTGDHETKKTGDHETNQDRCFLSGLGTQR